MLIFNRQKLVELKAENLPQEITMWALSCSRAVSGRPPVGFDADNWLSILVSHRRKSSISPWKPWACSGTYNRPPSDDISHH